MKTLPNEASTMNARVLTAEEVAENVHDDDFVWIEIRHDNYGCVEDETFNLRVHLKTAFGIDFSLPNVLLHCEMEEYGKVWRIWNICPDWDNDEIWKD